MSTLFSRGRSLIDRFWDCAIAETVTLKVRGSADTFTSVTGITAIRRVLAKDDERVLAGVVSANTITFHLRNSTMSSNVVRIGDLIVDANSVEYVVTMARQETWEARWRVEVVKSN